MKQIILCLALIIIGSIPFILGIYLQNIFMVTEFYFPTKAVIFTSLVQLSIWFFTSMIFKILNLSKIKILMFLNFSGFISSFLILIQLFSGRFWMGQIGLATQIFYLPLIGFVSMLFRPIIFLGMGSAIFISFLLLVLTSYLGICSGEAINESRK